VESFHLDADSVGNFSVYPLEHSFVMVVEMWTRTSYLTSIRE